MVSQKFAGLEATLCGITEQIGKLRYDGINASEPIIPMSDLEASVEQLGALNVNDNMVGRNLQKF